MSPSNKTIRSVWHAQTAKERRQKLMNLHAANIAAVALQKEEEARQHIEPGSLVEGEGIYIGQYRPRDREGRSLGKIFNVFAAPQDLTDEFGLEKLFMYITAVQRISELKNWHGFDGGLYNNDTELYQALRDGSYKGEWIIPTLDLLISNETTDTLYACQEKGLLKGTFAKDSYDTAFSWYWSCTEETHDDLSCVRIVQFSNGLVYRGYKDDAWQNCRPVRLVALP